MGRERISQVLGYAGLVLLALGASMYAANSPQRHVTYVAVASGAIMLLAFAGLNFHAIRGYFGRRSSRHGANMAAVIILFSCVLVIVQALATRHSVRYDMTRNQRFSLAGQTLNVLAGLERDVEIFAFFTTGTAVKDDVEGLLDQYAHHSPRIRYEIIDPDQKPARVKEFDVKNPGTTVVRYGDKSERLSGLSEEGLTNAILKLARDEAKAIYFVWGHGERDISNEEADGYSILSDAIEKENYVARNVSLFEVPSVPADCAILISAGPKKDYLDGEIEKIVDYLSGGGNAIFMIDPVETLPRLEALLGSYRALLEQDVVIDPYSRVFGRDYTVPVVREYVDHPITLPMNEATLFPMARSVNISAVDVPGVRAQYLALAGKSAWGEIDLEGIQRGTARRDDNDISPPIALAMIATKTYENGEPMTGGSVESKVVLFGDSDFAANRSFRLLGNGDLLLNAANYLAEEKDLIAIRAKEGLGDRLLLTASQGRLLFLVCVVLLPLAVISFGTAVFVRSRRNA